jgi:hypothetical protein
MYSERTTLTLEAEISDEDDNPLINGQIQSLTMTIYAPDLSGAPIINNRKNVNILNANGCTLDSSGLLTILLTEQDTVCIGSAGEELHRHLITWTYSNGSKTGRHEIDILLKNMYKVG